MSLRKPKIIKVICSIMPFVILLTTCSDPGSGTTVLNKPTDVSASVYSADSIIISWSPVAGATSYDVYFQTDSIQLAHLTNVSGTSYIHRDLQPNTTYNYYVRANNNTGQSDYSGMATATITLGALPPIPTGVNTTPESTNSIRITWNPSPGATKYNVYYAIGSPSAAKIFAASVESSPYIHTGLQTATTYYYFIRAENGADESTPSSPSSCTTLGGAGTDPEHAIALYPGILTANNFASGQDFIWYIFIRPDDKEYFLYGFDRADRFSNTLTADIVVDVYDSNLKQGVSGGDIGGEEHDGLVDYIIIGDSETTYFRIRPKDNLASNKGTFNLYIDTE